MKSYDEWRTTEPPELPEHTAPCVAAGCRSGWIDCRACSSGVGDCSVCKGDTELMCETCDGIGEVCRYCRAAFGRSMICGACFPEPEGDANDER